VKYQHLFFDLDRTLWDYDANSTKALTDIFHAYQLAQSFISVEEFLNIYNHHNNLLWDDYRKGLVIKEDLRTKRFELTLMEKGISDHALCTEIGAHYMHITPRLNILALNTISTLDYLMTRQYKLYILTNGFLSTQQQKMAHSQLDRYFIRIYSSEELGINKPHAEIFHWAVSSVHGRKKECLMIGDDLEVDIIGAKNYGIDTVWYNPEGHTAAINPTFTISNMDELQEIL
jgi:putative hydrolase of the HAD superfamily